MSAADAATNSPSFLNTDDLQRLGKNGMIIMIVGIFLLSILIICTLALIVWYTCKGKANKAEKRYDDRYQNPKFGIKITSDHQRNLGSQRGFAAFHSPEDLTISSPTSATNSPNSQLTDINSGASTSAELPVDTFQSFEPKLTYM
ncbi:uncharacterized protein [Watersipora subatra]